MTGVSPCGSDEARVVSFSLTTWRALKGSMPQSNSTKTKLLPCIEVERTRLTLAAPLTAVSMGNDTSRSTSSGAMPWASVITTTVGALRSGNTSTSEREAEYRPAARQITAIATTAALLLSEKRMIPFRRPFSCCMRSMA